MALKGRYFYLYGLQTDALANDTKTNDSDKGVAEDDAAGSSIDEVPNGKPQHTLAEGQNGQVAASTQNGDICALQRK